MKAIKEISISEEKAQKLVSKLNAQSIFGSYFVDQYPYEYKNEKYRVHILANYYIKYSRD
jgi:hypothetical protein